MNTPCDTCAKAATCPQATWDIATCDGYVQKPSEPLSIALPKRSKYQVKAEKDLQSTVSGWLHLRGYWYRNTTDILNIEKAPLGWMIHYPNKRAKGNPFLLDIVLMDHGGHCFEFELKIPGGKWAGDEQRALCQKYGMPVFTDFDAVKAAVVKWEKK